MVGNHAANPRGPTERPLPVSRPLRRAAWRCRRLCDSCALAQEYRYLIAAKSMTDDKNNVVDAS